MPKGKVYTVRIVPMVWELWGETLITCKNTSYCGLLGKTMESKCKINDQNM